ncbi:MAG: hypothetical protein AAF413_03895 [Patescibacteria group bacterium]
MKHDVMAPGSPFYFLESRCLKGRQSDADRVLTAFMREVNLDPDHYASRIVGRELLHASGVKAHFPWMSAYSLACDLDRVDRGGHTGEVSPIRESTKRPGQVAVHAFQGVNGLTNPRVQEVLATHPRGVVYGELSAMSTKQIPIPAGVSLAHHQVDGPFGAQGEGQLNPFIGRKDGFFDAVVVDAARRSAGNAFVAGALGFGDGRSHLLEQAIERCGIDTLEIHREQGGLEAGFSIVVRQDVVLDLCS